MKLSRDKVNHISSLIVKNFDKMDDFDYKVPLNEIRLEVMRIFLDELKVDDQAEIEVRKILSSYTSKPLREGTSEWDVLYEKHYNEYLAKHGL
jgi:uncharacterized protein